MDHIIFYLKRRRGECHWTRMGKWGILSVVEEIPEGNVATYGQIARLIGREKNARLVGKALSVAQYYGDYPCHRVVNHAGRLVPGWKEQGELLKEEGVPFRDSTHVDIKKCIWDC